MTWLRTDLIKPGTPEAKRYERMLAVEALLCHFPTRTDLLREAAALRASLPRSEEPPPMQTSRV